jgi:hypothetical protein
MLPPPQSTHRLFASAMRAFPLRLRRLGPALRSLRLRLLPVPSPPRLPLPPRPDLYIVGTFCSLLLRECPAPPPPCPCPCPQWPCLPWRRAAPSGPPTPAPAAVPATHVTLCRPTAEGDLVLVQSCCGILKIRAGRAWISPGSRGRGAMPSLSGGGRRARTRWRP